MNVLNAAISSRLDFIDKPINPTTPRLFTVISTFAGCGGSSLGYKWAGGKVLAAIEWEQNAVDTYLLNHKGTYVLHRDIATVTGAELLELTGLKIGELDIFDGSPPCQGFSTAGKRDISDSRNQLFREYVRLLRELQPKVFVMENVSGMVKGKMKLVFVECLKELKVSGYKVSARLLNAMYFGVPQSRQRIIFIGVREDLEIEPTYPKAQTQPITVGCALVGVPAMSVPEATGTVIKNYIPKIPRGGSMASVAGYGRDNLIRPDWGKPCPTIRKDAALSGYGCFIHPDENRFLSVAEYRRLSSFPDDFQFTGYIEAKNRIGNSVPPRFMMCLAEHIYENILNANAVKR